MAQALAKVGAVCGQDEVKPCLMRLAKDADTDVRFYANESMEILSEEKTKTASENPAVESTVVSAN